ncbi:MAG: DNA polymerase III subunit gamma/tau [Planctomycetota bacterium]|nr:DNA polymerase III subunit gamma/tau [Planctomycetota bacterium]
MSYLVLARKYRPTTFSEVAGQEIIINTLRGAIEKKRIAHAYLFTGPRGTGKTTTARLLAKALNCELGPTTDACGKCERCLAMDSGAESDVIEIDAASNTSVDDVRILRDQAGYMPLNARFKIFIIDEVHMLSKAAFNALLKTLEEPPAHVKFLFATTEPHKVLDTILSRCQVLKLSPLPEERIVGRLQEVFAAEGVQAEAGVCEEIARRARGGMRDALSIADQLLSMVGDKPKLVDMDRLSGDEKNVGMVQVVAHILAGSKADLLADLPSVEGVEADWLAELLDYLRATLLATLCGANAPMLEGLALDDEARTKLVETGKAIGGERLELWLQELLHARERMRLLPSHGRLILEVTLLDLCSANQTLPIQDWCDRLEGLERRLVQGGAQPDSAAPPAGRAQAAAPAQTPIAAAAPAQPAPAAAPQFNAPTPAPQPDRTEPPIQEIPRPAKARAQRTGTPGSASQAWDAFLLELKAKSASLADILERRGRLAQISGNQAVIQLTRIASGEREMIMDRRNARACTQAFSEAMGQDMRLHMQDEAQAAEWQKDEFTADVVRRFEGRVD